MKGPYKFKLPLRWLIAFVIFLLIASLPTFAASSVMKSDTTWSGQVLINEDVLIPEGITLTILPGTVVRVSPSESTKIDPEYISPLTEITVRGSLKCLGKPGAPVSLLLSETSGTWAGIIVDGGNASLLSCAITDAETGIYIIRGSADVRDSVLKRNHYGLVAHGPESYLHVENSRVEENDYGLMELNGARAEIISTAIKANTKKDKHSLRVRNGTAGGKEYIASASELVKIYKDESLLGDTVWHGRIRVNGIVRIPENSRLIVLPGTVVEFSKRDTDGDGIGENGLMIQGLLIAKGTSKDPILFRSAGNSHRMGDWDAINIMNSDGAQNVIEYCQIEDAYRGLHFHFSNVAVKNSILCNNYRGIQFQESVVIIRDSRIYGNKSGLQARDSETSLINDEITRNYTGINIFRVTLTAKGNTIAGNFREGIRIREGIPTVEKNLIDGNRQGLLLSDNIYGSVTGNVVSHNLENGISLKDVDNAEIGGNFIQGNGLNGISIQDATAVIKGNHISENDRGIGIVSFRGIITENDIVHNGTYALGVDGKGDVSAPANWWGEEEVEKSIFDNKDDPKKGRVEYAKRRERPLGYAWPLTKIANDVTWYGVIYVHTKVTVAPEASLSIAPRSRIIFSEGAGLKISGRISARGNRNARIVFTSLKNREASEWDEIELDHASESIFLNCNFEHATWSIHNHFSHLTVDGCIFKNNYGGIRFMSGPIEVKNCIFSGNSIGIRAFRGIAEIHNNVITENETGIFVREKGSGLILTKNNIFRNSNYNIRLGDFNNEDVQATENWWGSASPGETIFDEREDPGIGKVLYEPHAARPFKIDLQECE